MRSRLSIIIVPSLVFLLFIFLWEWGCSANTYWRFVIPTPSSIFSALMNHPSLFITNTLATFKVMGGGLLLACAIALPLAWLMMISTQMSAVLQPAFVIIKTIPMFTLAPIMVVWLGWSYLAMVIPTALMIFFPLTLSFYKGLTLTPTSLLEYFKMNRASNSQIFFKLQLPWALPHLFSGLKVAAGLAGIGAITGEWAGAQQGLGVLMLESRYNCDLNLTFGALFVLTSLSLSMYCFVLFLERMSTLPLSRKKVMGGLSALLFLFSATLFIPMQGMSSSLSSIRLTLDWLPNPNHVPLYVGVERGFFQEEGIELEIQKTKDPSDPILLLNSGRTDVAISYLAHAMRAYAAGADIKVIGMLIDRPLNCILFRGKEGITTPKDLNGRIIGYCTGDKGCKTLEVLLRENNIVASSLQNVSFDLVSMLRMGQVDAVYGPFWNIEPAILKHLGLETHYFTSSEMGAPPYQGLIILSSGTFIKNDPKFTERFQRAIKKSIAFCKKFPNKAFESYIKIGNKSGESLTWEREAWEMTYPILAESQKLDLTKVAKYSSWLYKNNLLAKPMTGQELL